MSVSELGVKNVHGHCEIQYAGNSILLVEAYGTGTQCLVLSSEFLVCHVHLFTV